MSRGAPSEPPGPVYLDTSALVPLYLHEPAAEELSRGLVGRRDAQLTDLTITEFVSALARRERDGDLDRRDRVTIYRALSSHVADEHYLKIGLSSEIHRAAERMLLSSDIALKTADALHLAAAVSGQARTVATLDGRMRQAASLLGLDTFPAHQP